MTKKVPALVSVEGLHIADSTVSGIKNAETSSQSYSGRHSRGDQDAQESNDRRENDE